MPAHPKVVAIVQARLGSSRLPLKSLLCLRHTPIIDWVTDRLARAAKLDAILVAVPDTPLDTVLAEHLHRRHISCLAGPENDVLERYRLAAAATEADWIVRVCADNPLIWGAAIDRLVEFFAQGIWDYAYNHIPRNNLWPDGLGAEIFYRELLEHMAHMATCPDQREHCCNYIWDNQERFRIGTFDPKESWLRHPELKLDVDSAEDFCRLAHKPIHPDMEAREIVLLFTDTAETAAR